eukprot:COSAG01_NODE_541_length_15735_cov_4.534088_1_plen_80_part_00
MTTTAATTRVSAMSAVTADNAPLALGQGWKGFPPLHRNCCEAAPATRRYIIYTIGAASMQQHPHPHPYARDPRPFLKKS